MKLAIFSDSHDHVWNTRKAVSQAIDLGVEMIIHCGDLISPFMLEELDPFPGEIHLVYGNNVGDQTLLTKHCAQRNGHVQHHGWLGRLDLKGFSLGWLHDPSMAYLAARSGEFRLVCWGHTHRWRLERVNDGAILLNPGEILGKKEPAGWALVEIAQGPEKLVQSSKKLAQGSKLKAESLDDYAEFVLSAENGSEWQIKIHRIFIE